MHAPLTWPTKYLPKFRTKRIAVAGFGFLLASCSDGVTQPGERPSTPDASAAKFAPDVVIMERTTTDAASEGQAPLTHSTREVLTATVRLAGHGADVRTLPSPTATPASNPRPPLSLPARRELAICNALPSWTERTKGADGHDIILTGVGDAPASTISIVQADGSVWNVERTWTRTTTSWQLDKQVTRGARGYRDVVTYHHENAAGKAVDNAIPARGCAAQEPLTGQPSAAASRNYYAPYSSTLYLKLVPGSGISADDGCWEGGGDPCFDKRMSVYRADVYLVTTATAMTLACVTPVNVTVVLCVGAINAYAGALANLIIEQAAYRNCMDNAAAAANPTGPQTSIGGSIPPLATSPAHASLSVSPVGATRLNYCGGGDNTASGVHCRWDTYEISYDHGDT